MRRVKLITLYFLTVLMLFSSLGVSFYLHDCGCRHTFLLSVSLGFSEPEQMVCCTSCPAKPPIKENDGLSICKQGCCRDYVYFYLLPVAQDNVIPTLTHIFVVQVFKAVIPTFDNLKFTLDREAISFLHSPPLIFSGTKIIYLFKQIKIPFPTC